jgi:phage FluMu protein Com
MKNFVIPKCPECKKELIIVNEIIYERYDFDKKSGRYFEKGIWGVSGELVIECYNCGADITNIFEEGACNYQAKRR